MDIVEHMLKNMPKGWMLVIGYRWSNIDLKDEPRGWGADGRQENCLAIIGEKGKYERKEYYLMSGPADFRVLANTDGSDQCVGDDEMGKYPTLTEAVDAMLQMAGR